MNSAFFENTYASFVRMYYQKTFDAMIATPLTNLVDLARAFTNGSVDASVLPSAAYLTAFAAVAFPLAIRRMRRRLIK